MKGDAWSRWSNNRVTHMTEREHDKAPWPEGPEGWNRPDKLVRMAKAVLGCLREGGEPIPVGGLRDSYYQVLTAADQYLSTPTPRNHQLLPTCTTRAATSPTQPDASTAT